MLCNGVYLLICGYTAFLWVLYFLSIYHMAQNPDRGGGNHRDITVDRIMITEMDRANKDKREERPRQDRCQPGNMPEREEEQEHHADVHGWHRGDTCAQPPKSFVIFGDQFRLHLDRSYPEMRVGFAQIIHQRIEMVLTEQRADKGRPHRCKADGPAAPSSDQHRK